MKVGSFSPRRMYISGRGSRTRTKSDVSASLPGRSLCSRSQCIVMAQQRVERLRFSERLNPSVKQVVKGNKNTF